MSWHQHWTPIYFFNKAKRLLYQWTHPGYPWLTPHAINLLSKLLKSDYVGLEFGSGRSTIWFSSRVRSLTSIEHDPIWYKRISDKLKKDKITNVDCHLVTEDCDEADGRDAEYVKTIGRFSDGSLDFALVDGVYRSACACAILDKIKPGGLVIIDNANWYLPSQSISPTSRTIEEGQLSPEWSEFLAKVGTWKCTWTSNGLTDTALYVKPEHSGAAFLSAD